MCERRGEEREWSNSKRKRELRSGRRRVGWAQGWAGGMDGHREEDDLRRRGGEESLKREGKELR